MTLTLHIPDELQARLTAQATRSGLAPDAAVLGLLEHSLAEQEAHSLYLDSLSSEEKAQITRDLKASADDYAAGRWVSVEDLQAEHDAWKAAHLPAGQLASVPVSTYYSPSPVLTGEGAGG